MKKKEIIYTLSIIIGIISIIIFSVQISKTIEITDVTGYLTNSSGCTYIYIGTAFSSSIIPSGYVNLTYKYEDVQFNTTVPSGWLCVSDGKCCAELVKNKNTVYVFIETEKPWIVNVAKLNDTWLPNGYILLLILSISFTLTFIILLIYYEKTLSKYGSLIPTNS